MSISSRITEIEQHITNAYDGLEDIGADLTNIDKNINNISTVLDNVWNDLPKVTASDVEEATLNGTKKGRMNIDAEGNTYQEQLSGKNLLNGASSTTTASASTSLNNNIITISSTVTTTIPYCSWEVAVSEGDVVRLNGIIQNSNGRFVRQTYDGSSWGGYSERNYIDGTSISSLEYTAVSGITKVRFNLYSNNVRPSEATSSNYTNVIITKNNSDMTYEPYCGGIPSPNPDFPQTIHNVSGNNNIKIQNKNLFDGEWTGNTSTNFIQVFAGKSYIYSEQNSATAMNYRFYDSTSSSNYIQSYIAGGNAYTPSQDGYIKLYKTSTTKTQCQLEQGSTATSYVAHQEQNLPFTFAEGQKAMQGTTLQDDGIHQKRKQVVFDGSEDENWTRSNSLELFYTGDIQDSAKAKGDYLCNYFIKVSPTATLQNGQTKYSSATNTLLQFKNTDITTVSAWREWLSTHNVIVEYELAEEEIIPYSETQQEQYNAIKQARSYDDQTNISQTNEDLPFILDITALKK